MTGQATTSPHPKTPRTPKTPVRNVLLLVIPVTGFGLLAFLDSMNVHSPPWATDWPRQGFFRRTILSGTRLFNPPPRRLRRSGNVEHRLVGKQKQDEVLGGAVSRRQGPPGLGYVGRWSIPSMSPKKPVVHTWRAMFGHNKTLTPRPHHLHRDGGIWTIQASLFPENAASLRLHEDLGDQRCGAGRKSNRESALPHRPLAGQWRAHTVLIDAAQNLPCLIPGVPRPHGAPE